jgi:hypothetical protein
MPDPSQPTDFLNTQTLLALGGATTAVTVVSNVIRRLTRRMTPWIPFVVSLVVVLAVTLSTADVGEPVTWLLAAINACLVFTASSGVQDVVVQAATPRAAVSRRASTQFWLAPWF